MARNVTRCILCMICGIASLHGHMTFAGGIDKFMQMLSTCKNTVASITPFTASWYNTQTHHWQEHIKAINTELDNRHLPIDLICRLPLTELTNSKNRELHNNVHRMLEKLEERLKHYAPNKQGSDKQTQLRVRQQSQATLAINNTNISHNASNKHKHNDNKPIPQWIRNALYPNLPLDYTIGIPTLDEARTNLDKLRDWIHRHDDVIPAKTHGNLIELINNLITDINAINNDKENIKSENEYKLPLRMLYARYNTRLYHTSFSLLTVPRIGIALATYALSHWAYNYYNLHHINHACLDATAGTLSFPGIASLFTILAYTYGCEPTDIA